MEKIENNVCSIFIDESYRNFTKALNLINNTTDKNINEIYDRVLVISDENVYKTQLNKFIDLLNAKFVSEYIVPAGEESKCIDTFEKILEHGLKAGLTRKSLIIAVGGGVVGDLSGYVAASYMRGIDFVQVPTTLLAQVDSSIGGKTGINLGTYKNVVGAFYQPQFTFINVSALRTLPDSEFRNGMSEVVKYGFIYDYEFINYLLENSEDILDKRDSALRYIVKKCAEIKAHVVEVDEKEVAVREQLPGNNCGGCGYPVCSGLAAAIAKGEAPVDQCPVGGAPVAAKIGAIMGQEVKETARQVAFVKCAGTCDKTTVKYEYTGVEDCEMMAFIPGSGAKNCTFGCMGFGSCVKACPFDAIHIVNGIAVVDQEACKACGKCVAKCPRHLIELVPYKANHLVQCSSHDKGPAVKKVCEAGCIGCTLCTKQCEFDAIHMDNNVAVIDYTKCTGCGKCAAKCPAHVII